MAGFLNNRHYLNGYGIFVSVDPIAVVGQPVTLNPYVYSHANPVTLSDPSGLIPDFEGDDEARDAWFERQRETFHDRFVGSHESSKKRNQERAEQIRYWANCSGDYSGRATFAGACAGADLLEGGQTWTSIQPYLVGVDQASVIWLSEPESHLLALFNAGMVAAYEETGFLPDYFVLDAEFITQWGWGVGGLAVLTRTGTHPETRLRVGPAIFNSRYRAGSRVMVLRWTRPSRASRYRGR